MERYVALSNGVRMPVIGLGTWKLCANGRGGNAISDSVKYGYKLFDTAWMYGNERLLAEALKASGAKREDVFLTSKVHPDQFRGSRRLLYFDKKSVEQAYDDSLRRLRTEYLDMFMLHDGGYEYPQRYAQLVELHKEGRVRSIGVCNVDSRVLAHMVELTGVAPHVVQCQLHPLYQKKRLQEFCKHHKIVLQAHSQFALNHPKVLEHPVIEGIALTHGKSVRQVILRWLIQKGICVIPRSSQAKNIEANIQVFDFWLTEDEMSQIDNLDEGFSVKDYDKPNEWV